MSPQKTPYQSDVIAEIEARGHSVSFGKPLFGGRKMWLLDGYPLGTELSGKGGDVQNVSSAANDYRGVWRHRRLTGKPEKDAAMLLDRHGAVVQAKAADDAHAKARLDADDLRQRLRAAFRVPGGDVQVQFSEVTFSVRVKGATPALAGSLAKAILGVLSEEK